MNSSTDSEPTNINPSLRKKILFIGLITLILLITSKFSNSSIQTLLRSQNNVYERFFKTVNISSIQSTTGTTTSMTSTNKTASTTTSTTTTSVKITTASTTISKNVSLGTSSTLLSISTSVVKSSQETRLTTTPTTTTSFDEVLCDNMTLSKPINELNHPCERIRCNVILRGSGGRLGNRMFMYAAAYGLARAHNCRLHIAQHILNELESNFKMTTIDEKMWLSAKEVSQLRNIPTQLIICEFIPKLLLPRPFQNLEITGYWQSYLYFDAYKEEIREFFSSRNHTLNILANYLTSITKNICPNCPSLHNRSHTELRQAFRINYNITWISIHLRREDFRHLGYSSDDDYVRRAMSIFRKRYYKSDIRFLVASDDKPYCEQLFRQEMKANRVFVLPSNFAPREDLMALTLCHHSIVSGGTYGFWTAYLTGGDVIHDIRYRSGCSQLEYYPPWFLLIGPLTHKSNKASNT